MTYNSIVPPEIDKPEVELGRIADWERRLPHAIKNLEYWTLERKAANDSLVTRMEQVALKGVREIWHRINTLKGLAGLPFTDYFDPPDMPEC